MRGRLGIDLGKFSVSFTLIFIVVVVHDLSRRIDIDLGAFEVVVRVFLIGQDLCGGMGIDLGGFRGFIFGVGGHDLGGGIGIDSHGVLRLGTGGTGGTGHGFGHDGDWGKERGEREMSLRHHR